jgi:hypothetical protein
MKSSQRDQLLHIGKRDQPQDYNLGITGLCYRIGVETLRKLW